MKLFSLLILYNDDGNSRLLQSSYELSNFSFYQRGSVREFIRFTAKILSDRSPIGSRQSVKENEYMCHIYSRPDKLVGVCVADHEYPQRVAHTLITNVMDEFSNLAGNDCSKWRLCEKEPFNANFEQRMGALLARYQDPKQSDPMSKIQNELDETKIVLHNTIAAVLERGEKLDDLVAKSEGLSMQSKTFYKTAKKTNSCCSSWA